MLRLLPATIAGSAEASHKRADRILSIVFVALPMFLYGSSLPHWWLASDDPQILKQAVSHPFWEYFFVPSAWRELTIYNLTPWVTALYDIDVSLFGLRPSAFYLHHLVVFGLLSTATYHFLRLWLSRPVAAVGSALFALSPPYGNAVFFLATRHYAEGLLWTLLAVIFYTKALRQEKPALAYLGSLCYIVAALCKEIYVPLFAILPFWPESSTVRADVSWFRGFLIRAKYFMPFGAVAVTYSIYRTWMLGYWGGGYGSLYPAPDDISAILAHLGNLMFADTSWLVIPSVFLALLGLLKTKGGRIGGMVFSLMVGILIALPLWFVLGVLSGRHLFLPMFMLLTVVSCGLDWLAHRGNMSRLVGFLCVWLLVVGFAQAYRQTVQAKTSVADRLTTEGLFIWNVATENDSLFVSPIGGWYYDGLLWLKPHDEKGHWEAPSVFADLCHTVYVGGLHVEGRRFWKYEQDLGRVIRLDPKEVKNTVAECLAVYRPKAPLTVRILEDDGKLDWTFGPYETGYYVLVDGLTGSPTALPRMGRIGVALTDTGQNLFRICYHSAESWVTCSESLQLAYDKRTVTWERASAP